MATRRARLAALLSGGAIPDTADYQVRLEPEGTLVGTVNEDWAVESNGGDIFQLGNASWRVLRIEPGIVRVADAKGQPPSLPFWLGEAPGRTRELAAEIGTLREECAAVPAEDEAAAALRRWCGERLAGRRRRPDRGLRRGGAPRSRRRPDAEARDPRAVLRRERRHAAHRARSVRIEDQPRLGPGAAQEVLRRLRLRASGGGQRGGDRPLARRRSTASRWRKSSTTFTPTARARSSSRRSSRRRCSRRAGAGTRSARSCSSASRGGKKVPANLLRMRANDLLAAAFPQVLACPETLPGGPIAVPMEHPIVAQTIEDCLTEAMDVDGFLEVLRGLKDGSIERCAVDTVEPSSFARGILSSQPYTLPGRRSARRAAHAGGPLPPRPRRPARPTRSARSIPTRSRASARRRGRSPPTPRRSTRRCSGWDTSRLRRDEPWQAWLDELAAGGAWSAEGDRWFAAEATRDPKAVLRGRMEALGPVSSNAGDEPLLLELESEGVVLRTRIAGRRGLVRPAAARAHPPLHARPPAPGDRARHRRAVPALPRLLAARGPRAPARRSARRGTGRRAAGRLRSPRRGLGGERAAGARARLPARVAGSADAFRRGDVGTALGRRRERGPARADLPRPSAKTWTTGPRSPAQEPAREPSGTALEVYEVLLARGAMFFQELARATKLPPAFVEAGLDGADRAGPRDVRLLRRPAMVDRAGLEAKSGRHRGGALERRSRARPSLPSRPSSSRAGSSPAPASSSARRSRARSSRCRGATSRACAGRWRRAARFAAAASWPASTASSTPCPRR